MLSAQRRPGHKPRRHVVPPAGSGRSTETLNEGRGINPGDTCALCALCVELHAAQRRPGHKPRRHLVNYTERPLDYDALNEGRGINPGDTCHPAATG